MSGFLTWTTLYDRFKSKYQKGLKVLCCDNDGNYTNATTNVVYKMVTTPSNKKMCFQLTMRQFPISVCFAMNINIS